MKRNTLIPFLLAVFAFAFSTLACSFESQPGVSNIRMTTDDTGNATTTTYSPRDDFFVYFDVNAIDPGTVFQGRWYALNINGEDPGEPFSVVNYNLEDGVNTVYFKLYSETAWPVGMYRVDIYMSDKKIGETQFNVK